MKKTGPYGTMKVMAPEAIFEYCKAHLETLASEVPEGERWAVGLSGGSTPKAFFKWWSQQGGMSPEASQRLLWTVSDERCVPLEDPQSNFGEASRLLLDPSHVPAANRLPWPTQDMPDLAAKHYREALAKQATRLHTCFLGMGQDGHTASLWPGCPLLDTPEAPPFSATEWPQKGWRLTITLSGLKACDAIWVLVSGQAKTEVLKAVWEGPEGVYPVQALKPFANKITWLVDEALF